MEVPMFSQVPAAVLSRIKPIGAPCKRARFRIPEKTPEPIEEDEDICVIDEDSSSASDQDSPPRQESPRPTSPTSSEKISADAILQVTPTLVSVKTQTDESIFRSYDELCRKAQQSGLSLTPMYTMTASRGEQPPLKIGLSGLKRKKRKVFYPGEESD